MPRRPNKTDYGMLGIDADVEAFSRKQGNEECDEFEKKLVKRLYELSGFQRWYYWCGSFFFGAGFFRAYETGWNDGHSNGFQQGMKEAHFYTDKQRRNDAARANNSEQAESQKR